MRTCEARYGKSAIGLGLVGTVEIKPYDPRYQGLYDMIHAALLSELIAARAALVAAVMELTEATDNG